MMKSLRPTYITVQRDVCDRICNVCQLKELAINLCLPQTFINQLNTFLISSFACTTHEEVVTLYDANYDSIIEARDTAFNDWMITKRNAVELPTKTVTE